MKDSWSFWLSSLALAQIAVSPVASAGKGGGGGGSSYSGGGSSSSRSTGSSYGGSSSSSRSSGSSYGGSSSSSRSSGSSYGGSSSGSRSSGSSYGGSSSSGSGSRSSGSSYGGSSSSGSRSSGSSYGGSSSSPKSSGSTYGGGSSMPRSSNPSSSSAPKSSSPTYGGSSNSNPSSSPKAAQTPAAPKASGGGWLGGGNKNSSSSASTPNTSKPSTPVNGGGGSMSGSGGGNKSGGGGGLAGGSDSGKGNSGSGDNGNSGSNTSGAGNSGAGGNGGGKSTSAAAPAPGGGNHKRTATADGGHVEDHGNHQIKYGADGSKQSMTNDKRTVHYDSAGKVSKVVEHAPTAGASKGGSSDARSALPTARPSSTASAKTPQHLDTNSGHKQTKTADGGTVEDRGSHQIKYRPDGSPEFMKTPTGTTQFRQNGTVAQTTRGKTVTNFHDDGSKSVVRAGKPVYTQRNTQVDGRPYVQRSYVTHNNTTVNRYYSSYYRGGYAYHSYVPMVSYDPWFYGYCYHPWTPVYYRWGWYGEPWYPYYGYYFSPYPTYYGPSYWLTDYMIASSIRSTYQQQAQQPPQVNVTINQTEKEKPQITEAEKDQIRAQVEQAIREHEKKQPNSLEDLLRDTKHIFVVDDDYDVLIEGPEAATCSLNAGDLIRAREALGADEAIVKMTVVTSKKGSCPAKTKILVSLINLQEMQNAFSQSLEEGMEKLKTERPDLKTK